MNSIIKIQANLSSLTKVEEKIAVYILNNLEVVINESVQAVAKHTNTSASAVVRLSKTLGFNGFTDLKLQIARDLSQPRFEDFSEMIEKEDNIETLINKAEHTNQATFLKVYRLVDAKIVEEVINLLEQSERIFVVGLGGASIACEDLYHKLTRINKTCIYNQDFHLLLTSLAHIEVQDTVIVFSYSGKTREALIAQDYVKQKGGKSVAITSVLKSPLAKASDYTLLIPQEEKELRLGAISSRFAFLAVSDLLYLGMAKNNLEYVTDKLYNTRLLLTKLSQ